MKYLLILGAGSAGTMTANRLVKLLPATEWRITIVDPDPVHYYQPGYLFVPFGMYTRQQIVKPKNKILSPRVQYIQQTVEVIEPQSNKVRLKNGEVLPYDFLVIATGNDIYPAETPGFAEHEWGKSIHSFYTMDTAEALFKSLQNWQGGRLVMNVVENPIKCPVAPMEFLMLADSYFIQRGMRDRVELIYATPLPGAFTKPVASQRLGEMLEKKNIKVEPEFYIERADPDAKKIISYDEREIEYDLLVTVPLNKGAEAIGNSGLGNELNYVPVDKHTFLSTQYDNIFALGDAADLPTSKAGSVAHFAVDMFTENFERYIHGKALLPSFDGHANCFIESGFGKGVLIDFNYDTEPLPGVYPMPIVGPFPLLKESVLNHWGKFGFKWMYFNILLRGLTLPLPPTMSMAGKQSLSVAA